MNKHQVTDVLLVGGSTHIPKIQQMLKDYFNDMPINVRINPDQVVAYGATMQAAILRGINSFILKNAVLTERTSSPQESTPANPGNPST